MKPTHEWRLADRDPDLSDAIQDEGRRFIATVYDREHGPIIVAAVNACFASERPLDFATAIPAMVGEYKRLAKLATLCECSGGGVCCGLLTLAIKNARALLVSAGIEWRETK